MPAYYKLPDGFSPTFRINLHRGGTEATFLTLGAKKGRESCGESSRILYSVSYTIDILYASIPFRRSVN